MDAEDRREGGRDGGGVEAEEEAHARGGEWAAFREENDEEEV